MAEKDEEQEGEKWSCESFLVCVCHLEEFWEFDGKFFSPPPSSASLEIGFLSDFFLLQNWMWRENTNGRL